MSAKEEIVQEDVEQVETPEQEQVEEKKPVKRAKKAEKEEKTAFLGDDGQTDEDRLEAAKLEALRNSQGEQDLND